MSAAQRFIEVGHPCPGAQAGERLVIGSDHSVIAYQADDGTMVAAAHLRGSLLRRDHRGWWTAGPRGERCPVAVSAVAALVGCLPDGWPCLAEQSPLLG
jgi:hypothetical protein